MAKAAENQLYFDIQTLYASECATLASRRD